MFLKITKPLPGKCAQLRMAPPHRLHLLKKPPPEKARQAAVLLLLSPANEGLDREELLQWEVLLIRRNVYPGVHSGQISFPGGEYEAQDGDFWQTACRETFEEVGIAESCLEKIGPLSSLYVPPSNFTIHPFAAVRTKPSLARPDPREVAGYKNIPLRMLDPEQAVMRPVGPGNGRALPVPVWEYEGFVIWGATAMILAELYQIIDDGMLQRV